MTGILLSLLGGKVSVEPDPYFEYTTLLLPGNGTNGAQNNTFLDGSTNNFTITRNGNTTQGTFSPFSQTGWGNYFDGADGSNLSIANSSSLDQSGDFTQEVWYCRTGDGFGTIDVVFIKNLTNFAYININQSTGIVYANQHNVGTLITGTTATARGVWYHIALTRSSNSLKLFVNGVQEGSTVTYSTSATGTATSYIGGFPAAHATAGYLSNLRVTNTAVYTSNFTPPTTPLTAISGTSLLTCQSNRFIDNSSNNFTITRNGDTRVVAFSPFNPSASWSAAAYGGSGYFDGNGDYLTTPNVTALQLSNSVAWTIELWFYANAMSGQQHIFHGYNTASPYPGWGIALGPALQPATTLLFWDGTTWRNIASGLSTGQWYHVAVAYDGSGTTGRLYLNGNQQGSSFAPASTINNTSTAIGIGGQYDGSFVFNGYVNGTRIVKGTAVYTGSTYPVPTAPLTAITNTSLLLNFTNAGIYDATSKNDLETVGNAQISTAQSKWGGSSMAFDGTGDYLLSPDQPIQRIGTGNFTIEGWVYRNSSGTYGLIGKGTGTTGWLVSLNSSNQVVFTYGSSTITSTGTVSATTWTHIAVVREGTSTNQTKIYINGTNDGTGTVSTDFNQTNSMYVGADRTGGSSANAYMQDVRVTNYARYTANFTAPTAPFPTF